jgi:hypothetical protein
MSKHLHLPLEYWFWLRINQMPTLSEWLSKIFYDKATNIYVALIAYFKEWKPLIRSLNSKEALKDLKEIEFLINLVDSLPEESEAKSPKDKRFLEIVEQLKECLEEVQVELIIVSRGFQHLTEEELEAKEDEALYKLMQEVDNTKTVDLDEFLKRLEQK